MKITEWLYSPPSIRLGFIGIEKPVRKGGTNHYKRRYKEIEDEKTVSEKPKKKLTFQKYIQMCKASEERNTCTR